MDFIIYNGRLYPPVIILTDTDWVQGGQLWATESLGKKIKIFKNFLFFFKSTAMNISMWLYYSVTRVLSENILLWYILNQKT